MTPAAAAVEVTAALVCDICRQVIVVPAKLWTRGSGMTTTSNEPAYELCFSPRDGDVLIYRSIPAGVCGPFSESVACESREQAERFATEHGYALSGAWESHANYDGVDLVKFDALAPQRARRLVIWEHLERDGQEPRAEDPLCGCLVVSAAHRGRAGRFNIYISARGSWTHDRRRVESGEFR